jgi:hypothetical protein
LQPTLGNRKIVQNIQIKKNKMAANKESDGMKTDFIE